MIQLHNLSFQYGEQKNQPQIKNINLHVEKGEFILLTGKSGCGKTTLTRVLNGLCPQFFTGSLTGTYMLEGRNAAEIPIAELGTLVGSVFQDPRSQFFATNTTDEIALGLEHHGITRDEIRLRLSKTAAQIGV